MTPATPCEQDRGQRRLFVYNGGFLDRRIRRIVELAGWRLTTGIPGPDDWVGVWGKGPTAWRGEAMARRTGARLLRIEDAFLRSIHSGRAGEPPAGLLLDHRGIHFDPAAPSDFEDLLANAPLDDPALLDRARVGIERIRALHLSKYNAHDPTEPVPEDGFVLVIDQVVGDASIRHGSEPDSAFARMLEAARDENPGCRIVIKPHPDVTAGHRAGHLSGLEPSRDAGVATANTSPWALLHNASAVYTVSSQMGFEAILAGHRPRVFGQPFYAGWGLTQDEAAPARRRRRLRPEQVFAASMILMPRWYDPFRDRLCTLETVIDHFEARLRAFREDRGGYSAEGMRAWKRPQIRRFFGADGPLTFRSRRSGADRRRLVWASHAPPSASGIVRVEDGFLRSRGLGAQLVPAMSLIADDLGIHFDPGRESRLERMIAAAAHLSAPEHARAERLMVRLVRDGISKYNTGRTDMPELPGGHRILVPGQVEDDASVRLGCGDVRTNAGLLQVTRTANPDAIVIYKPHPDVEAGLRPGAVPPEIVGALADRVVTGIDPALLIGQVDAVWTMTSLLGFEALLRGKAVTCVGTPFYAGWGLTTDTGAIPARRAARPSLEGLVHAALISYPRYLDPVTGRHCPVEVVVDRLADGNLPRHSMANRGLSRLQSAFAWMAPAWR